MELIDQQIIVIDYYNKTVCTDSSKKLASGYPEYMEYVIAKTIYGWKRIDYASVPDKRVIQTETFMMITKRQPMPKYILGEETYKARKQRRDKMMALRSNMLVKQGDKQNDN